LTFKIISYFHSTL